MTAKNTKSKSTRRANAARAEAGAKGNSDWEQLPKGEQDELAEMSAAHLAARKAPKMQVSSKDGGTTVLGPSGVCETQTLLKLCQTFGTVSLEAVNSRTAELIRYLQSVGMGDTDHLNAALSFVHSMGAQNQAEALLLVQMYVTHDASIRAARQLGSAEYLPQMQAFGNLANKFMRTFQGQMEALARMRRGGEQVVRHVHVDNRGGQAVIVENVHNGGKGNEKIDDQSHATGSAGVGPALLGADPLGNGVPISSGEGAEAVPHARGHQSGRA